VGEELAVFSSGTSIIGLMMIGI